MDIFQLAAHLHPIFGCGALAFTFAWAFWASVYLALRAFGLPCNDGSFVEASKLSAWTFLSFVPVCLILSLVWRF